MQTLKALNEIKSMMNEQRNKLLEKRSALYQRLRKGNEFFQSTKQNSKAEIAKASAILTGITKELAIVEKEIFDLDVIIGTKLEILLNDCEVRVKTASKKNDMGETTKSSDFVLSLFDEEDKEVITPEDLWVLKIIKPALRYCNIEVTEKSAANTDDTEDTSNL